MRHVHYWIWRMTNDYDPSIIIFQLKHIESLNPYLISHVFWQKFLETYRYIIPIYDYTIFTVSQALDLHLSFIFNEFQSLPENSFCDHIHIYLSYQIFHYMEYWFIAFDDLIELYIFLNFNDYYIFLSKKWSTDFMKSKCNLQHLSVDLCNSIN